MRTLRGGDLGRPASGRGGGGLIMETARESVDATVSVWALARPLDRGLAPTALKQISRGACVSAVHLGAEGPRARARWLAMVSVAAFAARRAVSSPAPASSSRLALLGPVCARRSAASGRHRLPLRPRPVAARLAQLSRLRVRDAGAGPTVAARHARDGPCSRVRPSSRPRTRERRLGAKMSSRAAALHLVVVRARVSGARRGCRAPRRARVGRGDDLAARATRATGSGLAWAKREASGS